MKYFFLIFTFAFHAMAQTSPPASSLKAVKDMKKTTPTISPVVIDVKPAQIDMFKKSNIESLMKLQREKRSVGGWGSSGGGSGVACFSDSSTAQIAGEQIDNNQMLSPEVMANIKSLETLEYWEWKTIAPFKLLQSNATTADELVKLVHYRIAQLLPLFVYRLEQAGQLIEVKNWDSKSQVPRINDARPARPLPENCRQVQLAARFAKESYTDGSGPSKKLPIVKVELNQALFQKLDILNKAILILHEQFYLLGQLTGHKSSDEIRGAVMVMISEQFGHGPGGLDVERYMLKKYLISLFGDYLNYFGDDLKLAAAAYSQESRFNSYYHMLNRFREKIGLCEDGKMPESEKVHWRNDLQNYTCKDYMMNPDLFKQWLTDEMAFVYSSSYMLDFAFHSVNSELLITPFAEGPFRTRAEFEVLNACQLLKENLTRFANRDIPEKAVRYCEGFIRSLSPMGKGQN